MKRHMTQSKKTNVLEYDTRTDHGLKIPGNISYASELGSVEKK